jgi:hypothetical protein
MEITIKKERKLLHAVSTGVFTLQAAKANFLELIQAVKEYQAKRVLYDGRTLKGEVTTMDRFNYNDFCAQEVRKLVISQGLVTYYAYVLNPPILTPDRFGQTVANNRGMRVLSTDSIEEAMEWLESRPA